MASIDYRINCQTCVIAYEMRRRGYDVEAKGRNGDAEAQMKTIARDSEKAWIDPETGEEPKLIRSERPLANRNVARKWLEDTVKPGERYFLAFCYRDRKAAHIITCERNQNGGLQLYDPQSGRIRTGQDITEYFGQIALTSAADGRWPPKLMRVDNLLPRLEYYDTMLKKART